MSQPSEPYRVSTDHGVVDIVVQRQRVQNTDPSNPVSEIDSYRIRRSQDQTSPAPRLEEVSANAVMTDAINRSAEWLRFEGNLGPLRPTTAIIGINDTQGGAYMARWHADARGGNGQLSEFLVFEGQGWAQVPQAVLREIPSERLTDSIRPGGTELYRQRDGDGDPHWKASFYHGDYTAGQTGRTQLTFAPNNELAIRVVGSHDPSVGSITTYGPGNDDLTRGPNPLLVPQGGRVQTDGNVTEVINPAGDIRTRWVPADQGGYSQIGTIEHLSINGEGSQWRVSQDLTNNSATLYRVDTQNRTVGQPVPLVVGSDNALIIPRTPQTEALDVSSLELPSGRRIGIVAPTVERSDPDVDTRQVPLTARSTPYSIRETVEEKAGWQDPAQAEWATRQVQIPRNIAEQLDIAVPAGQNSVTTSLELLPHQSAAGRFSMRDGTEIYANPAGGALVVANANTQTRVDAQVAVTEFDGAFMVPSNGRPAHQVLRELADRGLEPVAVLGTGFITPDPGANGTRVIGYHYTNFSRLEEGREGRSNQGETELRDDNNGTNLRAGYWVDARGEMHLLNFDRADPRFDSPGEVNAALKDMTEDANVVAIHLFTHRAADGPEDLIGNAPYDPDRGQPGWTPRPPGTEGGSYDTDPSTNRESRSLLVFDSEGDFVGRLSTPPVTTRDTYTVAREIYGERAAYVLNGDGDFYARAWYLDGREASDPLALGYENAMILVRPTADGQPAQLREFNDSERSAIRDYGNQEGFWDNLRDVGKLIERRWEEFQQDAGERIRETGESIRETGEGVQRWWDNIPFPWEGSRVPDAASPSPLPSDSAARVETSPTQVQAQATAQVSPSPDTTPPTTDPAQLQASVRDRAPLLNEPGHPQNAMFENVLAQVRDYERRRGIDSGDFGANVAGDLTLRSTEAGLREVRHVVFDERGTRAFAVDTPNLDAEWRRVAYTDVATAGLQRLEATSERLRETQLSLVQSEARDPAQRREQETLAQSAARTV